MAIFHVSHKTVGRSTHATGTAGAHADYIEREKACRITFGEHMPTKRGETSRWLDEQEAGDRKNARVIDKLTLALPLELDAQQRVELVRAFVKELSEGKPVPWLAAIHDNEQDADNPHCNLIIRDRHVETGKRAIAKGSISASKSKSGRYSIDASELHRVFPKMSTDTVTEGSQLDISRPPDETPLQVKVEALEAMLEREREALTEMRSDRDAWKQQATALLGGPEKKRRRWWPLVKNKK